MKTCTAILALLLSAAPVHAGKRGAWRKAWRISQWVSIGAHTIDAHSSWGRPEANPVIGPQFGARGVTIKAAIVGGWLAVQHFTNRRGRNSKAYAVGNFAMSGVVVGVATRNYRKHVSE